MTAYLKILDDLLSLEGVSHDIDSGQSVQQFVENNTSNYQPGSDQPIIVLLNGELLSPDEWGSMIAEGDQLTVAQRPLGIDPITWFYIIVVAYAVVVATQVSIPDNPATLPDQSASYNVNAQGNAPKLGQPIPVRYGRWRVFPDWAANPYREYSNNDQYLYQLFTIGQGSYTYTDLKIGETPIENFDDVTSQFYEAGQVVSLFRPDVYTAPEVAGAGITLFGPNESEFSGFAGPYVVNAAGTQTDTLLVDLVFPRGLNSANDDGGLDNTTVSLRFEYREIDDNGDALGSWTSLSSPTYTHNTVDVLRFTLKKSVPAGRYEIRADRLNSAPDDYKISDEVSWVGARSYLISDRTFDQAVWAVRIKATAQLSAQSERKFNGIFTRKLPNWNGTAWNAETATRNPMWAYCDALRSEYGGDYVDANLDLAAIKTIADLCDTRGDYFDGQFDTPGTLWPTIKQILSSCRSKPLLLGEQFSVVRDDGNPSAVYAFNGRNTVKPITVSYQTMDQWGDDSIEIEYTDPTSWKPETIICAIPGSPAIKPKKVKMPFITDARQANREGMFLAATFAYRTVFADIPTELDGKVPQYGDGLEVTQEYLEWGRGGELRNISGQRLTLSEPVTFEAGLNTIGFRNDSGIASARFTVTSTGDPYQVDVIGTLPSWLYTGNAKTKTSFNFANSVEFPRSMLVDRIVQTRDIEFKIKAVLDDPRVHQYDALVDAGTIITPPPQPPQSSTDLTITGVKVVHGGNSKSPQLKITWNPVGAAKRYFVEYSYDVGVTWVGRTTITEPVVTLTLNNGVVDVRIAAQDEEIGAWYQFQENVGNSFDSPETPTGFQLVGGVFNSNSLEIEWIDSVQAETYYIEYANESDPNSILWSQAGITGITASLDVSTALLNGLTREMRVRLYGVNANGVRSAIPATITVKNNQVAALTGFTVTGLLDQILVQWVTPSDSDYKGIMVWASQTAGFIPTTANLIATDAGSNLFAFGIGENETWYVRAAAYDNWGILELTWVAEGSAIGTKITETRIADDAIDTPHLKANIVTAAKMFISELSAITSNLGMIVSGLFKTSAGTGNRVEIEADHVLPFWYGSGTKDFATGKFYFDDLGNIYGENATFKGLSIYDDAGNLVMGSGGGIDWSRVVDDGNIPDDNATLGGTWGVDIGGSNLPADNATADDLAQFVLNSGSLSFNPDMTIVAADGRPAGVKAVYSGSTPANISYQDVNKTILKLYSATDTAIGAGFPAFRVEPGTTYTVFVRVKASAASASGLYARMQELDSELPSGMTHISNAASASESGTVEITRQVNMLSDVAITTTWVEYELTYTPAATAKYASLIFLNWVGMGNTELHVDRAYIANNATAGATWGGNLTGQPTNAQLLNAQQQYAEVQGTKPPTNADNTASNTSAMAHISQITASNIATFIAAAIIDTAYIKNLAVTEGKIKSLAVTTLKIANQAVTFPVNAFTSGAINAGTSWTTIQSVTIGSPASAPVHIQFSCAANLKASSVGYVYLYARLRTSTGTVIHDYGQIAGSFSGEYLRTTVSLMGKHVPGNSSVTYQLQMYYQNSATASKKEMTSRSMLAIAVKK